MVNAVGNTPPPPPPVDSGQTGDAGDPVTNPSGTGDAGHTGDAGRTTGPGYQTGTGHGDGTGDQPPGTELGTMGTGGTDTVDALDSLNDLTMLPEGMEDEFSTLDPAQRAEIERLLEMARNGQSDEAMEGFNRMLARNSQPVSAPDQAVEMQEQANREEQQRQAETQERQGDKKADQEFNRTLAEKQILTQKATAQYLKAKGDKPEYKPMKEFVHARARQFADSGQKQLRTYESRMQERARDEKARYEGVIKQPKLGKLTKAEQAVLAKRQAGPTVQIRGNGLVREGDKGTLMDPGARPGQKKADRGDGKESRKLTAEKMHKASLDKAAAAKKDAKAKEAEVARQDERIRRPVDPDQASKIAQRFIPEDQRTKNKQRFEEGQRSAERREKTNAAYTDAQAALAEAQNDNKLDKGARVAVEEAARRAGYQKRNEDLLGYQGLVCGLGQCSPRYFGGAETREVADGTAVAELTPEQLAKGDQFLDRISAGGDLARIDGRREKVSGDFGDEAYRVLAGQLTMSERQAAGHYFAADEQARHIKDAAVMPG